MASTAHARPTAVRDERCLEPVANCLYRSLVVPKIYFQKAWPTSTSTIVDMIVIDHAGTGDVHVVKICRTHHEAISVGVPAISNVPAHYRWVAYQGRGLGPVTMYQLSEKPLLPKIGMGRIGLVEVLRSADNDKDLEAEIRIKAERFRPGSLDAEIREFREREDPDIEFKD